MEQMPEELMARFEELAALEHEFEDVEDEISKSHFLLCDYVCTLG
jgi:hypothetical protein